MPVSLVKPSSTSWGMYSDQPNRLSSAAVRPAVPAARASARMSFFNDFMGGGWVEGSTTEFFEIFGEKHEADGGDDEERREGVQHGIEPLAGQAVHVDRQGFRGGAADEEGDDQFVQGESEGHEPPGDDGRPQAGDDH